MYQLKTHSPEETMNFSEQFAHYLQAGDVLTLSGDLGAGKTIFTKGLAKGLGIHEMVNSPTFTIVKEYTSGQLPLYHMDVYRISDEEDIGLEDYIEGDGVSVIEWAENIPSWLPDDVLSIDIKRISEHERMITCTAHGSRSERINEEISKHERTSH
ncbi:tRNA (adenosine(37)-N6)-threonylcarbamoyltransferase complex ATPase subunit type 1 TsaE [Sporolactobacillus kofuensis]|uniref:tRNA threonylcarbamoyladenosine biosynthesis protein TsaE n=1 Tax=Sporolactobacillus kofuensis TaxID=269672 RepID=A0ABW1WGD5_9BACL|nr:tRNA (adenosine(37)-N6)-threonylcarbamoyltransferase complex ATPase subunit type 1 TsaE [Sporolactobacillus kofuensis]MCO7175502.1 tRNA (adenosine(37)-N6)-threonylcarbamoyltransferase complex ATPase subunit type 1 TsaE [Sporolactobacillus kofuensis]